MMIPCTECGHPCFDGLCWRCDWEIMKEFEERVQESKEWRL